MNFQSIHITLLSEYNQSKVVIMSKLRCKGCPVTSEGQKRRRRTATEMRREACQVESENWYEYYIIGEPAWRLHDSCRSAKQLRHEEEMRCEYFVSFFFFFCPVVSCSFAMVGNSNHLSSSQCVLTPSMPGSYWMPVMPWWVQTEWAVVVNSLAEKPCSQRLTMVCTILMA